MFTVSAKKRKLFDERIRIDEDDCWIWQGDVRDGRPVITYDGVEYDALVVAHVLLGMPVPATLDPHSPLDVNPAHNAWKSKKTNKYTEREENAGMGQVEPSGDTGDSGNGTSQEQE